MQVRHESHVTSLFGKTNSKPSPLTLICSSPIVASKTSLPSSLASSFFLSMSPRQGTPIITTFSLGICFSKVQTAIERASQPFAIIPTFSSLPSRYLERLASQLAFQTSFSASSTLSTKQGVARSGKVPCSYPIIRSTFFSLRSFFATSLIGFSRFSIGALPLHQSFGGP